MHAHVMSDSSRSETPGGGSDAHPSRIDEIIERLGIPTVRYWTHAFSTLPPDRVGVVKVSGKLLEPKPLAQLAEEMAYLARARIFLPLVFGGGIQYNTVPGFEDARKVNGYRVTSRELMDAIYRIAYEHQGAIVGALRHQGARATPIPIEAIVAKRHGIELVKTKDKDGNESVERVDTQYVGDVASIDTSVITDAIKEGSIPVIAHVGFDGREYLNLNATPVATRLVRSLHALKLLVLGDKPVYDPQGNVISTLSRDDVHHLIAEGVINEGMVTNCMTALDLLARVGPGHAVQITALKERSDAGNGGNGALASTGLLEELVGPGSGTMFIEPSDVSTYSLATALERIGEETLRRIIKGAFDPLRKFLLTTYFAQLRDKNPTIYIDEMQAGIAIVYPLPKEHQIAYLDKLAVRPAYEGINIGRTLMDHVLSQQRAKHHALVWRVSSDNARAIAFYDGFLATVPSDIPTFKQKWEITGGIPYQVYGIGIPPARHRVVAYNVSLIPSTFQASHSSHS